MMMSLLHHFHYNDSVDEILDCDTVPWTENSIGTILLCWYNYNK